MASLLRFIPVEVFLLALALALGAGVHEVNGRLEAQGTESAQAGDVGPLPDGKVLRVLALGFDRLLADAFWLRTVYYVGDERSHAAGYPAAARLAQLVTDVDPSFRTVYVTMSGAVSALAGDPDGAIELLRKGVQHVDYWKLNFLLGTLYFLEKQDYARAAEQIRIAADKARANPMAPPYLPLLASRLYASAGDPETALLFIQARLREEREEATRQALERRYGSLWIERDLQRIDGAIAAYIGQHGRAPAGIGALVAAGFLEREPLDPQGGPYRIEDGRAVSRLEHDQLQVHRHGVSQAGDAP